MQPRDLHRPQKPTSPLITCLRGGCLLLVAGLAYAALQAQPAEGPSAVYEHTPALRPVGPAQEVAPSVPASGVERAFERAFGRRPGPREQRESGMPFAALRDRARNGSLALELAGSACNATDDWTGASSCVGAACNTVGASYVLLWMKGNHKLLAPGERGVVAASVADKRRVPLERVAWRVVGPDGGGGAAAQPPPPPRAVDAGRVHCVAPSNGVLLLSVSDRPNKWLCFLLHSALLHGLRPVVLGWDPRAWIGGDGVHKRPWTFHLGAKLVLPLEYLRRCAPPNDTLVVFTDHDVVFQGGYDAIRAAYKRASRGGARLLFSTEYESYPGDFKAFYPAKPAGAAFRYLNSGMWAGPAGDVISMLAVMTGAPTPGLMDYYLNWRPATSPGAPKPPRAFRENDQVAYAGLFLAQHFAQTCRGAVAWRRGGGGGGSCYTFVHDGRERCVAGGRPRCDGEALWRQHPLEPSMLGMDYGMQLFENMYHAGAHQVVGGRLRHRSSGAQPFAVHFNGPAKVTFESEWRLPWDAQGGRTPVACLLSAACTSFDQAAQATAERGFGEQVAILDATFQRLDAGPLNLTCEPCAAFQGC